MKRRTKELIKRLEYHCDNFGLIENFDEWRKDIRAAINALSEKEI